MLGAKDMENGHLDMSVAVSTPTVAPTSTSSGSAPVKPRNEGSTVVRAPLTSDNDVVVLEAKEPKNSGQQTIAPGKADSQRERELRRKKVKRMLRPGVVPSFVSLISPDEFSGRPTKRKKLKRICIDVDEILGLKRAPKPDSVSSPGNLRPGGANTFARTSATLPLDEGWFEGVRSMSLPDESRYLNDFHCVIRSNLEFFSATESDVAMSQAGRRTPVVRGKVGIRCIHCARNALGKKSEPEQSVDSTSMFPARISHKTWPAGSISYPVNIAGLYPVCSQKPALHFETCPNLPMAVKGEISRVSYDADGNLKRQRRDFEAMSAATYYAVAAKRIGLVDSKGGIRFGRDPSLEPLSMEAARVQVEEERASIRKPTIGTPTKPVMQPTNDPPIKADDNSERVLAEAVAEKEGDLVNQTDRSLVSDFVFLCVKQMAICHATKADFNSRGKKTKSMRIGFAGFCCRHCSHIQSTGYVHNIDFSCRSFSSAPDNLASAISSSFYGHLQKCFLVPDKLKKALAACKRLHGRQLARLPHGSQRRLFHLIWGRLRAADRKDEETQDDVSPNSHNSSDVFVDPKQRPTEPSPPDALQTRETQKPDNVPSAPPSQAACTPDARPLSFPVCKDEETQGILKAAEEEQEPKGVETLFLPIDRPLVTDFVFLIMKQVRVAHPNPSDFSRGRRSTVLKNAQAGLCCKYCMDQEQYAGVSGRTFPSQPDNLASSLNTSLHQHMQKCQFVPDELKRALFNLKKIHSTQLSHIRFGSQRRFFNLLFSRLAQVEVQEISVSERLSANPVSTKDAAGDGALSRLGFIKTASGFYLCQRCRMVPFELRASDSMSVERPTETFVRRHHVACKGDLFNLQVAASALEDIVQFYNSIDIQSFVCPSFKTVVRELVGGNEELVCTFTNGVFSLLESTKTDSNVSVAGIHVETKGLWCRFPSSVNVGKVQTAFQLFLREVDTELSPRLEDNHLFVRYFQIVAPSFVFLESEKVSAD